MKKIFATVMTVLVMCSISIAQTKREQIRDHKMETRLSKSELNQKASALARKEAKRYAKEGYQVAPGMLPLEKQLDRSYQMEYEYDDFGGKKYITSSGKAVGSAFDAARMQAINNAKVELAGLIETQVTALTESTLGNSQLTTQEAASINEAVQAGKSLIANKLGRVNVVVECYKNIGRENVEVSVRLAYNSKLALQAAKEVVKMKLEEKGKDLHEQLDKMWDSMK